MLACRLLPPRPVKRARGFTILELIVVVGIAAILAALSYTALFRNRPRADLMTATTELHALLRGARQNALSSSRDTVVMFFPQAANPTGGVGRVLIVEDPTHTLFGAPTPNFGSYDPTQPGEAVGPLLDKLELPKGVTVGLGGATAPTLQPPYANIAAAACSFCSGGGDLRGAVVFDSRGRARFYSAAGAPLSVVGGTIALQGSNEIAGFRMLIITSATGSVRVLNEG